MCKLQENKVGKDLYKTSLKKVGVLMEQSLNLLEIKQERLISTSFFKIVILQEKCTYILNSPTILIFKKLLQKSVEI